jgi:predicted DNA-binding protein
MSNKLGKYDVSETNDGRLMVQGESINARQVDAPEGDYIAVRGAWYLNALPQHIVVEHIDGSLSKFFLTPFRKLKDADFTVYKSYHPRKCKGSPLPDYLYRFYGLVRDEDTLSEVVRVRVSQAEKEKLEATAINNGKTVSEFLRELIARNNKEAVPMLTRHDVVDYIVKHATIHSKTDCGQYDIIAIPVNLLAKEQIALMEPEYTANNAKYLVALDDGDGYRSILVDEDIKTLHDALTAWQGDEDEDNIPSIWQSLMAKVR